MIYMDGKRNKLILCIFFIVGPLILLLSEFIPWLSGIYSPFYFISTNLISITSKIAYFLPIFSSISLLIVGIIFITRKKSEKVFYITLIFILLSPYIIFLMEMFSSHGSLLYNSIGVFVGLLGFGLVFFGILWVLIEDTPEPKLEDTPETTTKTKPKTTDSTTNSEVFEQD